VRLITTVTIAALVLVVVAGWIIFRCSRVLTDKDTIVLADFDNKTGDEIFDGMLKQALAIQLRQSPFLNIFPDDQARQTMKSMGRSPNERVTAEAARARCCGSQYVYPPLPELFSGVLGPGLGASGSQPFRRSQRGSHKGG
jgi:hypothetical protein